MEILDQLKETSVEARLVWTDDQTESFYAPIFANIKDLFFELEIETVSRGLRDCGMIKIHNSHWADIMEIITEKGLFFTGVAETGGPGFSHLVDDGCESILGVISQSKDKALELKNAWEEDPQDHHTIGRLLGYPECCIEFFVENWEEGIYDPMVQMAENSGVEPVEEYSDYRHRYVYDVQGEAILNPLLRYWGVRILSHIPCSSTCEESVEVANKRLDLMEELDSETKRWVVELLSLTTEWDVRFGAANVVNDLIISVFKSIETADRYTVRFNS